MDFCYLPISHEHLCNEDCISGGPYNEPLTQEGLFASLVQFHVSAVHFNAQTVHLALPFTVQPRSLNDGPRLPK